MGASRSTRQPSRSSRRTSCRGTAHRSSTPTRRRVVTTATATTDAEGGAAAHSRTVRGGERHELRPRALRELQRAGAAQRVPQDAHAGQELAAVQQRRERDARPAVLIGPLHRPGPLLRGRCRASPTSCAAPHGVGRHCASGSLPQSDHSETEHEHTQRSVWEGLPRKPAAEVPRVGAAPPGSKIILRAGMRRRAALGSFWPRRWITTQSMGLATRTSRG
eukprot:scaffold1978_cov381-Prasinococcus_capsulatus_cf.AAC.19